MMVLLPAMMTDMGHVQVSHLDYYLPDGRLLLNKAQWRQVRTLSGGEQKRLVLEALLRGPDEVLLLDEPDNYLDVPGKRWLEDQLRETTKTVLFVSHDRELLAQAASVIVSVEPTPGGSDVWLHGGGFATFHEAREHRFERFEELRRRWPTCSSTPHAAMKWRPATPPPRPGCASSRRPGHHPSRRASRTSGCGCAAAAPARGP
jgi:hypothetical protein